MRILTMVCIAMLMLTMAAVAQEITWERTVNQTGPGTYFDHEHHEEYVRDALTKLTGKQTRPDATREELAKITVGLLEDLRTYGEKQVGMVEPEIPGWFVQGYGEFNPATVSHSRYMDAAAEYTLAPDADIAALYAFWCTYDAEWFTLSRNAAYKAWLSAVLLNYQTDWVRLRAETADELHSRLVTSLQTPDEACRELDDWISTFIRQDTVFIKPKVRDTLVQELIGRAGLVSDARYSSETAYSGPVPEGLDLSDRDFYLLAALCLELSSEICAMEPETKQLLHFRDFFIKAFRYKLRAEAD